MTATETYSTSFLLPAASLARREIVRFLRQPGRVIGAVGTPIVFWLVLGSGMGRSFAAAKDTSSAGYLSYAYIGMLVLVVMFTAIFSSISVIQDRNEGFLQSVLVSPARRSSIAAGKILGAALLAVFQGLLFLTLAPFAGLTLSFAGVLSAVGTLFVVAVGLSGLGFVMAWRTDSVQGFHAVMNLLLMPLWLLSGAIFPLSGASKWLGALMVVNPLFYGDSALRYLLNQDPGSHSAGTLPFPLSFSVTALFAAAMMILATWIVSRPMRGSK